MYDILILSVYKHCEASIKSTCLDVSHIPMLFVLILQWDFRQYLLCFTLFWLYKFACSSLSPLHIILSYQAQNFGSVERILFL